MSAMKTNEQKAKFEDFLIYVYKTFEEDYNQHINTNITEKTQTNMDPRDGLTPEERLQIIYKRIRLNAERLNLLLGKLNQKLGKKNPGKGNV
jgi:hypothetical protein